MVLAIGGTDSGGCYGLQADQRTFAALGVHAAAVVTVVTAQNTTALRAAHPIPVEFVVQQLEAVLEDFEVAAVKTGMLGRTEIVEAVASFAAAGRLPELVVDPVLVNRHGVSVFGPAVLAAYRDLLLPHARLVTPNRDELALLLDRPIATVDDLQAAAIALGLPVLATGGRLGGTEVVDVFVPAAPQTQPTRFAGARVDTSNVAGTGDCLSAAVTAHLASGLDLPEAVAHAVTAVRGAVARAASWRLGAGGGPIDIAAARAPDRLG